MKISLNELSQKVGEGRRAVAALQNQRGEAIAKHTAARADAEKLSAELAGKDSVTADQKASLESANQAVATARDTVAELATQIADANAKLAGNEQNLTMAQEHNDVEDQLSNSAGGVDRPDTSTGGEGGSSARVTVLPPSRDQIAHDMGVMFQCSLVAAADRCSPADVATNLFGNERVAAAMSAGNHSAGGSWIAGEFSDRFVELLRPESVVRAAGVDSVPLDDGSLTIPKETGGPAGSYLGEQEAADSETVTTGDVKLIAKELVVQVPITEKLARSTSANATRRVRNSIFGGAGTTEDLNFIRGVASGAGPTGMRYQCAAANVITANFTINLANVTADLGKAELALLGANVKMRTPAWFMSPRSLIYLTDLRDGNGNLAYPALSSDRPVLRGKRVFSTTQIPDNIGATSVGSEVYLADASTLLIGDVPRVNFDASRDAAYKSGANTLAAYSRREVVMRLVIENDIALLHDYGVAVLDDVRWGA